MNYDAVMRNFWWVGVGLGSCSPVVPSPSTTPPAPVVAGPVAEVLAASEPVPAEEARCRLGAAADAPTSVDPEVAPNHGRLTVRREGVLMALPLVRVAVDTRVLGPVAETTVKQTFKNSYDAPLAAVYALPVAEGGEVDEFLLRAGSLTVRGEVDEIEAAREIYSAQPVALDSLEKGWPHVFMQGIPAIPAGAVVEVEVHLVHAPRSVDGGYELVVPAAVGSGAPAGSSAPPAALACPELDLRVSIRGGHAAGVLRSKHHRVRVERGDGLTAVRLEGGEVVNRDLVLTWRTAGAEPRATLLRQRDRDGGVFALVIEPPLAVDEAKIRAREVVFVLDTSKTMHGWRLDLARRAILNDVTTMRPGDAYQIVDLNDEKAALAPGLVAGDAAGRARGEAYLTSHAPASGAAPYSGLRHALALPRDPARVRQVLLFTHGDVPAGVLDEMRPHIGDARVHGFGLGGSHRHFLDAIAHASRGEVVDSDRESGGGELLRHADRVARPVLTDLEVDWGGLAVADVMPGPLPDVVAGRPQVVVGRFSGEPGQVRVRGKFGGAALELPVTVDRVDNGTALASSWARRRIDELQYESRDPVAVVGEIRELAERHRVLTPWTVLIARSEQTVVGPDGQPRTERLARGGSVDRDHDAILDFADRCPEDAETVNGVDDSDGCPEWLMSTNRVPVGVIPGVHFDGRVATIKAKSRAVLDKAVITLREFKTMRVEISGHTDPGEPRALGQRRAEAVRDYLVKHGVAADRIEVRNAGPDEPMDTNKTEPGRAKNRRIEFTILVR